jgi:hypothetical protein
VTVGGSHDGIAVIALRRMFAIVDPSIIGWLSAFLVFAGILAFLALGRRIGTRAIRSGSAGPPSGDQLETAVFALLGLMIAFTFSGALNRLDVRRAQVVDEANAIGTGWLRIALLPESTQPALRDLFRQYTDSRIATYRKLPDLEAARDELARSQKLQNEIWARAVAAISTAETRPGTSMLVMPALNQMFDLATVRTAATQMHPPVIIYMMLVGLALAAALLAGYRSAGERAYGWVHRLGFSAIVALTVYVILDMEYPRMGLIRIDAIDQVMGSVRASMN